MPDKNTKKLRHWNIPGSFAGLVLYESKKRHCPEEGEQWHTVSEIGIHAGHPSAFYYIGMKTKGKWNMDRMYAIHKQHNK